MIEFRALGPVELTGPEGSEPRAVLGRPKLLGLVAYLAAGAARGFHRRDTLIGLFWSELDQERARSAVRQSLYRIRRFLGENVVVTRGDDEVALEQEVFWSDVEAFEEALGFGNHETALELYRGDLLQGLYIAEAPEFERWLDERRKQLRERAAAAAWHLAGQKANKHDTVAAGHWSRHARNLAPLDERLLRRVIKLLDQLGDRSGAVREYEEFARRLADELELEPSPETKALIESVRARHDPAERGTAEHGDAEEPAATASPPSLVADVPSDDRDLARALADRYVIEKEIGAGGMATVYLARDLRHDRDVAVKVMRPELAATLGVERFLREIRIVAKLTHPHVVPLHDSGNAEGYLYYVMPYIAGESLRDRLEREEHLPLEEAVTIARDVADALASAHDLGVVHRDVKPENILLQGGHARVTDFGIAHAVSAASSTRLTEAGIAMGTPLYMSPEQGVGSGAVDGRSDTYSLGCVLYEMLAGQPPFTGPTPESVARQRLSTEPRPIRDLRPEVPEQVAAAVSRALAKTPADRFHTARQFADALGSGPIPARAPAPRRWRTRVAVPWALIVVILIVVVILSSLDDELDLTMNRVVVLPLANRTGDTALTLLGSMAADWITQGLQEIDVIEVVPTATGVEPGPAIAGLDGMSETRAARIAGETTGARTVVAGAYYRRGDSLEFQAQVIDASTDRLMRAMAPIAGPISHPGDVLDSLRARAVATVAASLDHRLFPSTAGSRPPTLEAYRMYLEGHRTFYDFPQRMREAVDYFYRAVELDSTFTDPRFLLVFSHMNLGEWALADSNAQLLVPYRSQFSSYQRATLNWQLASLRGDRAAALDAARARNVAADVGVEAFWFNRPFEAIEALQPVTEWTELGFNYFKWTTLMEAYHAVGNYEQELIDARRAREVYPDRLRMLNNEVRALAALGNTDELDRLIGESLIFPVEGVFTAGHVMGTAEAELRAHGYRTESTAVVERHLAWFDSRPAFEKELFAYKFGLAQTLYFAQRWDEARAQFEELAEDLPRGVNIQGYLGTLAARRGDRTDALRISDHLVGMADPYDFGRELYWQACIAAQLGELERAMVLLRESYARGRAFSLSLHVDSDLEPLRDYAPYQEFIKPKG